KTDPKSPLDSLKLRSDTPLEKIEEDFIHVVDQDSAAVPFKTSIDRLHNLVYLAFNQDYENTYKLQFYPGAITDWEGETNDTLQYTIRTKAESSYGSLHVNLQGVEKYPIIVDLLNERSNIVQSVYLEKEEQIDFLHLNRGTYFIRVSYDQNKNGTWDPGDFTTRTQPEPVIFFYIPIDVHANWNVNETFSMPQ